MAFKDNGECSSAVGEQEHEDYNITPYVRKLADVKLNARTWVSDAFEIGKNQYCNF